MCTGVALIYAQCGYSLVRACRVACSIQEKSPISSCQRRLASTRLHQKPRGKRGGVGYRGVDSCLRRNDEGGKLSGFWFSSRAFEKRAQKNRWLAAVFRRVWRPGAYSRGLANCAKRSGSMMWMTFCLTVIRPSSTNLLKVRLTVSSFNPK